VVGLIKTLSDEDDDVRRYAAQALAQIGNVSSIEALIKSLCDKNWETRRNAALSLGEFRIKSAIPALEKALDDINSSVYQAVREALNRIDSKVLHPDSDDDTPLFGDHHIYIPKTWRSEYINTKA